MPAFSKSNVQRVYLPSTLDAPEDEKLWVDIDQGITAARVVDVDQNLPDGQKGFELLSRFIVAWNNTDETTGEAVPINAETVGQMGSSDFVFLVGQMNTPSLASGGEDAHEKK